MAGVMVNNEKELVKLMVKDSKVLTAKQREDLFDKIIGVSKSYKIVIIPPEEIDKAVVQNNLNWLEADHTAEVLNELKPDCAVIDCPHPKLEKYHGYLSKKVTQNMEIICAHKADAKYPCVSAASILAKVTRDRIIEEIKQKIGVDFGSGYMSDKITADFLDRNWKKHPEIFRKSWKSYKRRVTESGQMKLGKF